MVIRRTEAEGEENSTVADDEEVQHTSITHKGLSKKLILSIFALRLFNAVSIKTFFQPDEYYQSLEPAHKFIFGYGYTTWEWKEELRSSIHPLIYAGAYKLASLVTSETEMIILAPKVVGAVQGCASDVFLYRFVRAYTGDSFQAKTALYLSLLNVFNWYFVTRSFSNGFEMLLTTIALSFWPWRHVLNKQATWSFAIGILSCTVRPTNALIWVFLGGQFLCGNYTLFRSIRKILEICAIIVIETVVVLAITASADRFFYGKWTFPLYNFIEFNYLKNLSIFYGVAPWHFYIFQGLPLMTMTYLPLLMYPLWTKKLYKNVLGQLLVFVVSSFSLIQHKEIRFIYPLQPVILLICSVTLTKFVPRHTRNKLTWAVVLVNIAVSYFFTRVHERGAIDVMDHLRSDTSITSFGFLTPCHSTPWQSNLHRQELARTSWFLTCEPPLHLHNPNPADLRLYRDQADTFYENPSRFLSSRFQLPQASETLTSDDWPSALIIFQPLEHLMDAYLSDSTYTKCKRLFNSYFHWDDRRTGDIVIYCKQASS